jgi:hypothetical protein
MASLIPQKIVGAQETHCAIKRPVSNKFDGSLSFGNVFCQFCGWHEDFHDEGGFLFSIFNLFLLYNILSSFLL